MRFSVCFTIICLISSCTSITPFDDGQTACIECAPLILNRQTQHPLKAFTNASFYSNPTTQTLRVYLEGDGRNWLFGGVMPPLNPTSRQFTVLKLMSQDSSPAIYINRPCNGYRRMPPGCSNTLWASARYSETIVGSLNTAIDKAKKLSKKTNIILIGHSGGGTLAMLLADRRVKAKSDVTAVVTLAANLDHQAWTQALNYRALKHSLNAAEIILPAEVWQWHLAGGKDKRVPPEVIWPTVEKQPNAKWTVHNNFDHGCCWGTVWPQVLDALSRRAG